VEQDIWLQILRTDKVKNNGYTRFRGLIDNFPHHGLPCWSVLHTFHLGLSDENRNEIDVASHEAFMERSLDEAWKL
jgi:hypothetical protein